MVTVIGSLGIRQENVAYEFDDGKTVESKFFPLALAKYLGADKIVFLLTEKARQKYEAEIGPERDSLCPDAEYYIEGIPVGMRESDLWDMFDKINESVEDGETVVFDITGSLRSIPFFMFLAINYLKVTRDVDVAGAYYGAFELQQDNGPVPVIDMGPALRMMEWITATDVFVKLGHADRLVDLIKDETPKEKSSLGPLSKAIEVASQAIWLARPIKAMSGVAYLLDRLSDVESAPPEEARPLAALLSRIRGGYESIALPEDEAGKLTWDNLKTQIELVRWYAERGHALQAYMISREWLVSLAQLLLGDKPDEMRVRSLRKRAERLLSKKDDREQETEDASGVEIPEELRKKFWDIGEQKRNDLMHAGMREEPMTIGKIMSNLEELPSVLEELLRFAKERRE